MPYTTIDKSSLYFNTKLYTGNGSTQSITGVGFRPDMTWGKARSTTTNHVIQTPVQGLSTAIFPNLTNAESTGLTNAITSFDTDGFSLGDWSPLNASSQTFVSWNWKASNATAVSNTDGSITSTVSANTTSGFSIVQWVGTGVNATIGHSLGVAPKCIIVKKTSGSSAWSVYHEDVGNTKFLSLNSTAAETTGSTVWNNTSPTSSVFSVGTGDNGNASGATYVAYCFTPVRGFSAMGLYEGTGSASSAPFIYTGFKPAWVILKGKGTTESWTLYDNKINPSNEVDTILFANLQQQEQSGGDMDFLSNGFKLRGTDGRSNGSGQGYVYLAFAEAPLVGSNNVPCTAR